jgi:hypothetical protein
MAAASAAIVDEVYGSLDRSVAPDMDDDGIYVNLPRSIDAPWFVEKQPAAACRNFLASCEWRGAPGGQFLLCAEFTGLAALGAEGDALVGKDESNSLHLHFLGPGRKVHRHKIIEASDAHLIFL